MADKRRIRYTDIAIDDLDVIFNFISDDNRTAAQKVSGQIETAILMLASNPRLGAVLPTSEQSRDNGMLRYIVVKPYIVFYRIISEEIIIARILHSRQDWLNLLLSDWK